MDPLVLQKTQKALDSLIREKVFSLNPSAEELELSFIAPNSEFVAELGNSPVINCYLIAINEDKSRRRSEPMRTRLDETKTRRTLHKEPRYVDISYMLTVWCKDKRGSAEIEHLLMGYLICGLGMFDFMPEDMLALHQFDPNPYGIRFTLFGSEYSDKISGQVWQAMGSTPKPSLMLSLSVPVAVHEPTHLPVIREIDRALSKK
ncbi:Pvc16 family protein [uncultured Shewanella sp.]|uniref:Pvc16 family protein n=1 Tax=uncultured Shewanella sp. TaxID=173975 RepID=UPI0026029E46|nr:Pvc16 family protein [uncultured Shewanella sp.]